MSGRDFVGGCRVRPSGENTSCGKDPLRKFGGGATKKSDKNIFLVLQFYFCQL